MGNGLPFVCFFTAGVFFAGAVFAAGLEAGFLETGFTVFFAAGLETDFTVFFAAGFAAVFLFTFTFFFTLADLIGSANLADFAEDAFAAGFFLATTALFDVFFFVVSFFTANISFIKIFACVCDAARGVLTNAFIKRYCAVIALNASILSYNGCIGNLFFYKISHFQNSVSFENGFAVSRLRLRNVQFFAVAFPKTEVLEKPQIWMFFCLQCYVLDKFLKKLQKREG